MTTKRNSYDTFDIDFVQNVFGRSVFLKKCLDEDRLSNVPLKKY